MNIQTKVLSECLQDKIVLGKGGPVVAIFQFIPSQEQSVGQIRQCSKESNCSRIFEGSDEKNQGSGDYSEEEETDHDKTNDDISKALLLLFFFLRWSHYYSKTADVSKIQQLSIELLYSIPVAPVVFVVVKLNLGLRQKIIRRAMTEDNEQQKTEDENAAKYFEP